MKSELQGEFKAGKRLFAIRTPPAETELPSFLLPSFRSTMRWISHPLKPSTTDHLSHTTLTTSTT